MSMISFLPSAQLLSEIKPFLRARLQNSSLHAQSATAAGFGLCVLPAYVARTAPNLVPVLPDEVQLTRSYWMVADPDMAQTAQVRLTQRFLRNTLQSKAEIFSILRPPALKKALLHNARQA
jgi:DNA-binding transcriptional LysR family regulator